MLVKPTSSQYFVGSSKSASALCLPSKPDARANWKIRLYFQFLFSHQLQPELRQEQEWWWHWQRSCGPGQPRRVKAGGCRIPRANASWYSESQHTLLKLQGHISVKIESLKIDRWTPHDHPRLSQIGQRSQFLWCFFCRCGSERFHWQRETLLSQPRRADLYVTAWPHVPYICAWSNRGYLYVHFWGEGCVVFLHCWRPSANILLCSFLLDRSSCDNFVHRKWDNIAILNIVGKIWWKGGTLITMRKLTKIGTDKMSPQPPGSHNHFVVFSQTTFCWFQSTFHSI